MKVICINNKVLNDPDGSRAYCDDLIEGEIYTAEYITKSIYGTYNCYFISELKGLRRCERFEPIDDNFASDLLERIMLEIHHEELIIA